MRRLIALLFCFAVLPLSLLLSGCVPEMEEEEESDLPELVEASAPVQPETGGTAAEGRLPERMALPYTPGAVPAEHQTGTRHLSVRELRL